MLRGFTIGGFRNFPNPPKWVAPLSRVNIFVGENNSGKSNILRYIQRVLVPSLSSDGKTSALTGIDRHQGEPGPRFIQVEVPFDLGSAQDGFRHNLHDHGLLAGLEGFLSPSGEALIASVSFPRGGGNFFPVSELPPQQGGNPRPVHDLWSAITGSSGGVYAEHWYPGVANWVTSKALRKRSCHYIQTFRSLPTRLPEFETEYTKATGDHLIDELAAIERPSWDDQARKSDFAKLQSFLQTLLENEQARVEVSADRTHIIVHLDGRAVPLEALGSGIHEVFMLAADIVLRDDDIVLIEEPETHLHPGLQRKLMMFLSQSTKAQLFITTHSSVVIDTPEANVFRVSGGDGKAEVTPLLTSQERFQTCRNLGYKASDLLQSNCVVWVEGPSDRLYLASWIAQFEKSLVEGVHFSIMFYGGRLISHLSADDTSADELIQLLPINRRCAILLDSDRGASTQPIRANKQRVMDQVTVLGGFTWLTEGREIENFYSSQDRDEAIKAVHKKVGRTNIGANRYGKPLAYWRVSEEEERTANKITVAEWLIGSKQPAWESLGLREKVDDLISFIRASNI